jgi:hypothetical protein
MLLGIQCMLELWLSSHTQVWREPYCVLPLYCGWALFWCFKSEQAFRYIVYALHKMWGWSLTAYGFTHYSVLTLHCGWALMLMHNIRACFGIWCMYSYSNLMMIERVPFSLTHVAAIRALSVDFQQSGVVQHHTWCYTLLWLLAVCS